jgi:hypothetical protein
MRGTETTFSFSRRRRASSGAKFDFGDATLLLVGLLLFGTVAAARLDLLPFNFSEPKEEASRAFRVVSVERLSQLRGLITS